MWLIVLHDPTGLAAVEESLDSQDLAGLGVIAQQGYVDLTMPKREQTLLPPTCSSGSALWGSAPERLLRTSPPRS